MSDSMPRLPAGGRPRERVLDAMRARRSDDVKWQAGRVWSLVFYPGDQIAGLVKDAYALFFSENGLNPTAFPSLRGFETDVVAMTAGLLGGDAEVAGNMTSGGTESILLTVLTAREWGRARRPAVREPEMILPLTAHPAFDKAAHYFGVRPVRVPVRKDFRADVAAVEAAITKNTVLLVGSAPSYPHGVVDPIADLARVARRRGLLLHVDACVGGMMLPFVRRLGYPAPEFDFGVPGVTSISVDLHKYGYAAKGASVILYRSRELHRHQLFAQTDWPGGIYASPTMTGTRPGGAIAAAWAVMQHLGESGYLAIADEVMRTTVRLKQGIGEIAGVRVLSDPDMSVFAIGSDTLDIYEVGDELTLRGWHLDRQQFPPCLHMTVNAAHAKVADAFLRDLAAAVAAARRPSLRRTRVALTVGLARAAARVLPAPLMRLLTTRAGGPGARLPSRTAAMYGMMGSLPNRGDIREVVLDLVESFTRPQG
ncbi:MAG: aspartate aminotransferase family protein [Kouleothrix sp.]|nr:aspartate aminotransferase family protein [Kouleothrix sp.]